MNKLAILIAATAAVILAPAAAADVTLIRNVTVIDGTGAAPQPGMTVVIDGDRIGGVMPPGAQLPDGREIDGTGKFLIPGLMDMHVHLRGGTEVTPEGFRKVDIDRDEGVAALHSFLNAGVTSIYDMGNVPDFILALRADERGGELVAPRIFATGGIVTYPGSHGSGPGATFVEDWPGDRDGVDAHIERKPDVVKFTFEERGWGARPMIPLLPPEMLEKLVEYYNDHGIRTTVHASSEFRARQAIFAGVDTLAHPIIQGPITEEFARLMAAKQIPMVTTLTIGENYSRLAENPDYLDEPLYRASLSRSEIERLKGETSAEYRARPWTWWMKLMTPIAQENLRQIHEAGGVLVIGTDQTIGPATHREMELVAAAGIAPLDVLTMATLNGAKFLGRTDDLGTIAAGKLADLVLLNSDPTADIKNARDIAWVMKAGEIVNRDRLRLAGRR